MFFKNFRSSIVIRYRTRLVRSSVKVRKEITKDKKFFLLDFLYINIVQWLVQVFVHLPYKTFSCTYIMCVI